MHVVAVNFSAKGNIVLLIGRILIFFVIESSGAVLSHPNPLFQSQTKEMLTFKDKKKIENFLAISFS